MTIYRADGIHYRSHAAVKKVIAASRKAAREESNKSGVFKRVNTPRWDSEVIESAEVPSGKDGIIAALNDELVWSAV